MRTPLTLALACFVTLAPMALGDPGPGAEPGLGTGCRESGNVNPCRGIIPDTNVSSGETVVYTGDWIATGTIVVEEGGSVAFLDANVSFRNTSAGIVAEPGGHLEVVRSSFFESSTTSEFAVVAEAGSLFRLHATTISGGQGVRVLTAAPDIRGNTLSGAALALHLVDVTASVEENRFVGNVVSVNLTGGMPTLAHNRFEGGVTCVRDWRSDPTIVHNVFRGCHTGIFHEQSESLLAFNDMSDDGEPPGSGIFVRDGHSPIIEGNRIANYGTGIRIENARAYVRNNTIEHSFGHGILVDRNSMPMDIQGNLVRWNGGDGINLTHATDVLVAGGSLRENGGHGLHMFASTGIHVEDVDTRLNGVHGAYIRGSSATILRMNASLNGASGVTYDPTGPLAILAPTELTLLRAFDNAYAGLHNARGNLTRAVDAWFEGNLWGVDNDDPTGFIDARQAYWGHPSGPRHTLNPLGEGDPIDGNVLFQPFRMVPPP